MFKTIVAFLAFTSLTVPPLVAGSKTGEPTLKTNRIIDNGPTESTDEKNPDPLEGLNRAIFNFNYVVDGILIKPMAIIFRGITPEPVRNGVHNVLDNVWSPISAVNYMLQGRFDNAGKTVTRFFLNTTMGLGGLMDAASEVGMPCEHTGFGDTLAVWGVEDGPYLMLPIIGPSTFREAFGRVVDYYTDPLYYHANVKSRNLRHKRQWIWYTRWASTLISTKERLMDSSDTMEKNSIDYYIAFRSVYLQHLAYRLEKRRAE